MIAGSLVSELQGLGLKQGALIQSDVEFKQVNGRGINTLVANNTVKVIMLRLGGQRTAPLMAKRDTIGMRRGKYIKYKGVMHAGGVEYLLFHVVIEWLVTHVLNDQREESIISITVIVSFAGFEVKWRAILSK